MTGWTKKGKVAHQREKVYAILRANSQGITVFNLVKTCWKSDDPVINKIRPETVRRILNKELDQEFHMAHKVFDFWYGDEIQQPN